MPISCLLPCADLGISLGGGGGGGGCTSIGQKSSDNVVCLFFAFFLVLSLFYRIQMVNFKEKYHFQVSGGGPNLSGGGGVQLFPGGGVVVELLIPYRNPYNL